MAETKYISMISIGGVNYNIHDGLIVMANMLGMDPDTIQNVKRIQLANGDVYELRKQEYDTIALDEFLNEL